MALRHFKPETDPRLDFENMDALFMQRIDDARERAGVPFVVTSSYRSPAHNKEVGGVKGSAHTKKPCKALDIEYKDGRHAWQIVTALMAVGFTRIGISSKGFIHVDDDGTKQLRVLFTYENQPET